MPEANAWRPFVGTARAAAPSFAKLAPKPLRPKPFHAAMSLMPGYSSANAAALAEPGARPADRHAGATVRHRLADRLKASAVHLLLSAAIAAA